MKIEQLKVMKDNTINAWLLDVRAGEEFVMWKLGKDLPANCDCRHLSGEDHLLLTWLKENDARFSVHQYNLTSDIMKVCMVVRDYTRNMIWECQRLGDDHYKWGEVKAEPEVEICGWGYCKREKDVGQLCWYCGN